MPLHLEDDLQTYFNYPSFKMGQKAIIEAVLEGQDVIGILPTGSGKSVCYQLPAKRFDGLTIVVSPLISLMTDQVKQLKSRHYKEAVAINSFLSYAARRDVLQNLDKYKLLYISPELLQNSVVQSCIIQHKISLFVIDEAHCISQWGHDFRPDYLKLAFIIDQVDNPPVLALSATAPPRVQHDIITALNRPNMQKHIYPMDRANIAFVVETTTNSQRKFNRLSELLTEYQSPAIVYFSSRQLTESIAQALATRHPSRRFAYYHGGMDHSDRLLIQQQFMNDQIDVICCTSAFGMGIDKHNIRLVVHYHLPVQVESYIQEIGRAGRDGQESVAILLYSESDRSLAENLLTREMPSTDNLDTIHQIIVGMTDKQKKFPSDDMIMTETHLNETQWRFLKQQFENHGIINDKILHDDPEKWSQALVSIQSYIEKRLGFKRRKLKQMIDWIKSTTCLRRQLYKHFQDDYTVKKKNCCSNCGMSSTVDRFKKSVHDQTFQTWQTKLKALLLQE